MGVEQPARRLEIAGAEQIVLVKRNRVASAAGGDRREHILHRAEPDRIPLIADARVAERRRVVAVLVGRAVVEERHLEVLQRLREDALQATAQTIELPVAGNVDGHERRAQLPISHSWLMTKSPSLTLATPWPVRNRSQRSIVNPIALVHASQRSTVQTPTLKVSE